MTVSVEIEQAATSAHPQGVNEMQKLVID